MSKQLNCFIPSVRSNRQHFVVEWPVLNLYHAGLLFHKLVFRFQFKQKDFVVVSEGQQLYESYSASFLNHRQMLNGHPKFCLRNGISKGRRNETCEDIVKRGLRSENILRCRAVIGKEKLCFLPWFSNRPSNVFAPRAF